MHNRNSVDNFQIMYAIPSLLYNELLKEPERGEGACTKRPKLFQYTRCTIQNRILMTHNLRTFKRVRNSGLLNKAENPHFAQS